MEDKSKFLLQYRKEKGQNLDVFPYVLIMMFLTSTLFVVIKTFEKSRDLRKSW